MQLIYRYCFSLLLVLLPAVCTAATDLSETFDVLWEMQWQQSGIPMNARKWDLSKERKLTYSISAGASKSAVDYVQEALVPVSAAAGIQFLQVDEKDEKANIEFVIRRFSDEELRAMPCYTNSPIRNWFFYRTKVTIAEQQAYRCALHEMMHVMGLSGHPMGDTVLTYFGGNRAKLSDIDVFVLKHWNSPLITPGMNAFRVTRDLQLRWIEAQVPEADRAQALEQQKRWFAQTVAQMDAFADGKGEPPRILYRSGRLNETGLATSRQVIQGILGSAYLEGFGVEKNPARAYELIFRGAKAQQAGAINALDRALGAEKFGGVDVKPACTWLRNRMMDTNRAAWVTQNTARLSKSCGDAFLPP